MAILLIWEVEGASKVLQPTAVCWKKYGKIPEVTNLCWQTVGFFQHVQSESQRYDICWVNVADLQINFACRLGTWQLETFQKDIPIITILSPSDSLRKILQHGSFLFENHRFMGSTTCQKKTSTRQPIDIKVIFKVP